ncbi:DUF3575 domain-containing protein [Halpernia sp.]|uniref:DUF3575 domain-containing protein n=1 Tax=Halpernia sp. TaxID=2782209 RepID=UPI003A951801
MRKFSFLILFFIFLNFFSQETKLIYVKANALFLPIGILNAGLEYQLSQKYTLQGDVFISPWKSFAGHELQYYSVSFEGRYYFKKALEHWYIGANISTAAFNLQKWSYWEKRPYINSNNEVFENSNLFQKGFSVLVGATIGYQFKLSENWNVDLYATAGTSQDFYKGYDRITGKRYDGENTLNKSGEFLPYRGGLMIAYKIR